MSFSRWQDIRAKSGLDENKVTEAKERQMERQVEEAALEEWREAIKSLPAGERHYSSESPIPYFREAKRAVRIFIPPNSDWSMTQGPEGWSFEFPIDETVISVGE